MSDALNPAPASIDTARAADAARLRRRHRAERRFRLLGLMAILFAALFIVVLLADIARKAWPAFFEHRVAVTLTVDPAVVDPRGQRTAGALRLGDFEQLARAAFRDLLPDMKSRAERRAVDSLLSIAAADDLRRRVEADPSLLGRRVRTELLLSATADLQLKGIGTAISRRAIDIPATVKAGETIEVTATSDVFGKERTAMVARLAARMRVAAGEAERLERALPRLDARQRDRLASRIAELRGEARDLRQRIDAPHGLLELDSRMPSILIAAGGALLKLSHLGPATARGALLRPFAGEAPAAVAAGAWQIRVFETPELDRKLPDLHVALLDDLSTGGKVTKAFALRFFTSGDSREPELAGIRGALTGSLLTLLVTLLICLPLGVAAAIYLEEFAPRNRFTDLIEVNINNLAAVPSIVFGLLGLAIFLNQFDLPRSAPLVGGLVLALLVLPTIIIASRAALKAVPPSVREAALGIGASQQQAVFHHVLPLAMPGIMTGTIIGMAHALGETAPLLMIGMVAFIVDVPSTFTSAATALPVQIYLWSDLPEVAFQAKTAAAICVLLAFLFLMNGGAILIRKRFERRW